MKAFSHVDFEVNAHIAIQYLFQFGIFVTFFLNKCITVANPRGHFDQIMSNSVLASLILH